MAYKLGNKYAKNLCKRMVLLQLIIENVVTFFLEHSVRLYSVEQPCCRKDNDLYNSLLINGNNCKIKLHILDLEARLIISATPLEKTVRIYQIECKMRQGTFVNHIQ